MNADVKGYLYKRATVGNRQCRLDAESHIVGRYYVDYMINGKRHTECLDTSDHQTAKERWADRKAGLAAATDDERYLRRLIEDGENAKRKLMQITHGGELVKVSDAFEKYLASSRRPAGTKERTLKGYRQQFNRFLKWAPATIRTVRDMTPALAESYVTDLERIGNAGTVNKHIGLLELLWKVVDHTWPNPWAGLHSTKTHQTTHYRRFTHKECRRIHKAADEEFKTLVLLGYSTGQRLGDLVCLKWGQVDMKKRIITLRPAKTDRRKAQDVTIPMTKQVENVLSGLDRGGDAVMPSLAMTYRTDATGISKRLAVIIDKAKVKDTPAGKASFHGFRHTFASLLAEAGANLQVQAALTSHTLPGVVGTYTHPDVKVLREWVEKAIPRL